MTDDTAKERMDRLDQRLKRQQKRIADLEHEIQETRRLHRRVAELADVVAELLVPALDRDDERVRAALHALELPENRD
jgi:predicted ribosome quality control (RQC) complex YloA/Tae2 family protein